MYMRGARGSSSSQIRGTGISTVSAIRRLTMIRQGLRIPDELNDHTTGHNVGKINVSDFYPEPYKWAESDMDGEYK